VDEVRIAPMGESAVLVTLGNRIDAGLTARARSVAMAIEEAAGNGQPSFGRPVAAYASVLVPFDPASASVAEAEAAVAEIVASADPAESRAGPGRLIEIPVRYGGADGPDLEDVARLHDLRPDDIVAIHAGTEYEAFFLGFAPGFAYLGPLPAPIATPRLSVPRPRAPAGSVAIAGEQTAIYPTEMPGGWRLIGRTDVRPWDVSHDPPALILPGDRVRFVPVER
jgi:inhibitor of KinA